METLPPLDILDLSNMGGLLCGRECFYFSVKKPVLSCMVLGLFWD